MKFGFIDAEKATYPVGVLCEVLEVSRSGFYAWKGRPAPAKQKADAHLAAQIVGVHKGSRGTYGSPGCTPSCAPAACAWAESASSD